MKRFALTVAGIEAFSEILYEMGDDKLQDEAQRLAKDPIGYITEHFELQVHQLEFLRNLSHGCVLVMGWNIASALVSRLRLILTSTDEDIGGLHCLDKSVAISTLFTGHFRGSALITSGQLHISISL